MTKSNTLPTGKIVFVQYHQPVLKTGDYLVEVDQTVTTDSGKIKTDNVFSQQHQFSVQGERFALRPSEITAVFPPEGSLGDHANVLPHIILQRSTLPWERSPLQETTPDDPYGDKSWLALLLFYEEEMVTTEIVSLSSLEQATKGWPGIKRESGQKTDDKVTVLRVKRDLLVNVIPTLDDLDFVAHVRHGADDAGHLSGPEQAVVIGNRLPQKGGISTAYLVSLEKRYKNNKFNYQQAGKGDDVTLICLKSWRFSCPDDAVYRITAATLTNLSNRANVPDTIINLLTDLKMQEVRGTEAFTQLVQEKIGTADFDTYRLDILKYAAYKKETFKSLLLELNHDPGMLRLPAKNNAHAEKLLAVGAMGLPHTFRQGSKSISWYHGPLVPAPLQVDLPDVVRTADELLIYDPAIGMFDTSYAAAWLLGRLLALQNKDSSVKLYQWKRRHTQNIKCGATSAFDHLPFQDGHDAGLLTLSPELQDWFNRISLLDGVPFGYLVPDEEMLPQESMRFFQMDTTWIKCLLDGAFSIGRVTTFDHQCDMVHAQHPARSTAPVVTGFLLRSDVVAGWPDLEIEAYETLIADHDFVPEGTSMKPLRKVRLSPHVLLCLFNGPIRTVDFHLKPEILHFGLDAPVSEGADYTKELRNNKGSEETDKIVTDIPWRNKGTDHVIELASLASAIHQVLGNSKPFTSAQFALEMIEGIEKVRFRGETAA